MSPSCVGGIGRGHTVGEHGRGLGRGGGLRGLEHRVYNFSMQSVGNENRIVSDFDELATST